MQLDKLAIALRPRSVWEATDLGVRIALNWYKPIYKAWLAFTVPIIAAIFIYAYYFGKINGYTVFLIWWLIPLFDRIALFVISRVVFGEIPSVKQCFQHLPYLLTKTHLFRALTYGRFSPVRALHLPSDTLEGLKGASARKRRRLLSRRDYFSTLLMTTSGVIIQYIFYIGALLLVGIMNIGVSQLSNTWFLHHLMQTTPLSIGIYLTVMLIFEPIYVAMGFSIYLKRRNELEAWDLELNLRKMDKKYQEKKRQTHAILNSLLLITLFFGSPDSVYSSSDDYVIQRQQSIEQAPQQLKQVLARPEFGETVEQTRWKFIEKKDTNIDIVKKPASEHKAAKLGREIMWILLAFILAAMAYYIIRNLRVKKQCSQSKPIIPVEITGLDIRPESLPTDIRQTLQQLLHENQFRAALSLLYRSTLSMLANHNLVPFRDSDTEQDCIKRVKENAPEYERFFNQLTDCWLLQAYAGKNSDLACLQQLISDWQKHFSLPENQESR